MSGTTDEHCVVPVPCDVELPVLPPVVPVGSRRQGVLPVTICGPDGAPGGGTQYIMSDTEYCAINAGVGYAVGDKVRVTYVAAAASAGTLTPPLARIISNLNSPAVGPIHMEHNGVTTFGTPPNMSDFGPCPAGPTSQLATIVTDFCAVANGAGYAIGDSVRLTRIIDLADPIGTPRVQLYSNLSAGVDQIIYLEEGGVPIFGTYPPNTDFGTCAEPLPSLVRWECLCDDGAVGVKAWQQFQSADNGLTWTLLGTFTEQYGTVPYIPVGVLVNCCDIGVAPTGKRARRTVLGVGSTVVPTGLPLVGALVESLSWSSRNATGTITDAAGTVSSFVAGEGGTWELEWIDTMTFDVTTGEVVIDWIEVY